MTGLKTKKKKWQSYCIFWCQYKEQTGWFCELDSACGSHVEDHCSLVGELFMDVKKLMMNPTN